MRNMIILFFTYHYYRTSRSKHVTNTTFVRKPEKTTRQTICRHEKNIKWSSLRVRRYGLCSRGLTRGSHCQLLRTRQWNVMSSPYERLLACQGLHYMQTTLAHIQSHNKMLCDIIKNNHWLSSCNITQIINWITVLTHIFIIKRTRCTNFTNLFWHEALYVSDSSSVHRQFIRVLLESCLQTYMTYIIAECTVNKLLMMDRRTVRNMYSFIPK